MLAAQAKGKMSLSSSWPKSDDVASDLVSFNIYLQSCIKFRPDIRIFRSQDNG